MPFLRVRITTDPHIRPVVLYIAQLLIVSNAAKIRKGFFHLCQRMDFLQTLHINNSLYTNYENVFIELDSSE